MMKSYKSAGKNRLSRREVWTGVALSGAAMVSVGGVLGAAMPAASAQVPGVAATPALPARASIAAAITWMPDRKAPPAVEIKTPGADWYKVAAPASAAPATAPAAPSAAALQAAIARAAASQVGQTNPGAYGGVGGEWCAAFASWVYRSAGLPIGVLSAAYQLGEWAQAGGGSLLPPSATPQVGDAVLFESNGSGKSWPGPGLDIANIQHVNIVASVLPDGSFTTIGGNERGANGVSAVRAQGPYSAATAPSWWGQTVYGFVRPGRR